MDTIESDIRTIEAGETGERILDLMTETAGVGLPNPVALVMAMQALRTVADSHGLDFDAACRLATCNS